MSPSVARHPSSLGVLAPALSVAACARGSGHASPLRVTRADSAGIEITTNETPADAVPAFATLDSTPGLKIGTTSGPKEEQFGFVAAVAPLSDGGVAVLDRQAAQVRVFGPDGAYVRTLGQKGNGPGELSFPAALVALPGDTLAVYDPGNGRITRFDPDGELDTIVTLRLGLCQPYVTSSFANGSMVGQVHLARERLNASGDKERFGLDSAALILSGADGTLVDTIGVFPGFESVSTVMKLQGGVAVSLVPAAFAHVLVFAAVPDGVWEGFSDHFSLRLLNPTNGKSSGSCERRGSSAR